MSKNIIFETPKDGIRNDDIIFIEITENCNIETAGDIYDSFCKIYPKAKVNLLSPDLIKSIRFFHNNDNIGYNPDLPF